MPISDLKTIRQRDRWDKKIRIAVAQRICLRNQFRIYEDYVSEQVKDYEKWLKDHNIEANVDLEEIKATL